MSKITKPKDVPLTKRFTISDLPDCDQKRHRLVVIKLQLAQTGFPVHSYKRTLQLFADRFPEFKQVKRASVFNSTWYYMRADESILDKLSLLVAERRKCLNQKAA